MSRLHAAHHNAAYRIPREHPRPDALRARLDGAMRDRLPDRLARTLALPEDDARVVLIRRLPVSLAVRADWSDAAIADAWTAAIALSLKRVLEDVPDGTMVFADRAAYLKEFLIDRAAGHAHERWYYRAFEGLALLPLSAAIRTAVLEIPKDGELALLRMSPPARNAILRALSEADAARVLRGLLPDVPSEPSERVLVRALERIEGGSRTATLKGYLELRESLPDEPPQSVGAAIERAGAFLHAAARIADVARLIKAIKSADLAILVRLTDVDTGQALLRLQAAPAHVLLRAAGLAEPGPEPDRRATPYGGAFLLLENLAELPLDDWCRRWPSAGDTPAAQALRWVLLLQSLGTARSSGASHDPVLRDLLGLPPTLDLRAWCRSLKSPLLTEVQSRLEAWQEAQGHLSGHRIESSSVWIDDGRGLYVPASSPSAVNEETRARLKHIPTDRAYLRPDPRTGVSRRVADGLAPLAMAVVRGFAWRLPGFGRAHLEHLARNFLACSAETSREEDTLRIHLTRPPLDLVLRMTRIARQGIQIPWTDPPNLDIVL